MKGCLIYQLPIHTSMERERLGSRLGFILLSAGCAIGLGNVWKFPYMVGENGGGLFVLIYVLFLLMFGLPILCMEFSMGRASRRSPLKMYDNLEPKGSKWHLHGYIALMGAVVLMMFYTVVSGWMLKYAIASATGDFSGMDIDGVANYFDAMVSDPLPMLVFTAIVVIVGFVICSFRVDKGLERVSKFMMIALLVLMAILMVNSLTLDGAMSGLEFYLMPNLDKLLEKGVGNVILAAMSQAFFTLSIGMGSMAVFGSYINKDRKLFGEAINVGVLDTTIAIVAGIIIFPACFTFGIDVGAGPSLLFVTLPNVFNNMAMGGMWGTLFFIFMSFAALSTVFAVFEAIISSIMDLTGWNRRKTCIVGCVLILALTIPCILGFSILSGFQPFGPGTNIMDLEDFIVSYVILPGGALIFTLFCTSRYGWGWKKFTEEVNSGKGVGIPGWMRLYATYILPIAVGILFVYGIINAF